ncbi:hypothetical protein C1H46_027124 [Malus baccata]|uniref:Uncharacterized protein n=1 Tax=Malus baccata TaxID=106549 RepID=A0A540LLG8_MALBA|nr:hypothetical protein C1H46_027124 [Malus baccata]
MVYFKPEWGKKEVYGIIYNHQHPHKSGIPNSSCTNLLLFPQQVKKERESEERREVGWAEGNTALSND